MLAIALAGKDKKINLEDIERDNLKSERKVKQESKVITSSSYTQQVPASQAAKPVSAPLQYNFLPLKTPQNYVQQQYTQSQQYPAPVQQYVPQQYTTQQYYTLQPPVQQIRQYKQQQYVEQPTQQYQYQQYENVPLVTDNSIAQQPAYYMQRYVYVQPYPAASTSVQSVVDPKGNVQYVMYIPTPTYVTPNAKSENTLQETQEYVNVVPQGYSNYAAQSYETPADNQYVQYVTEDTRPSDVQYVKATQELEAPKYAQQEYVSPKKAPKSLLDSYVPSYLQIQYYKQQQVQENAIRESEKASAPVSGKTQQVKTVYRTPEADASATQYVYAYQHHPIYAIPGTRK